MPRWLIAALSRMGLKIWAENKARWKSLRFHELAERIAARRK